MSLERCVHLSSAAADSVQLFVFKIGPTVPLAKCGIHTFEIYVDRKEEKA